LSKPLLTIVPVLPASDAWIWTDPLEPPLIVPALSTSPPPLTMTPKRAP
jgi:hypothetical protein